VLGIAKLLPQVVHVKRETQQVVSLAMTGLMRDRGLVFHISASLKGFKVSKFQGLQGALRAYDLEKRFLFSHEA